jgi:hypothetical protein
MENIKSPKSMKRYVNRARLWFTEARTHMFFMACSFLAFGFTLWLQPERYYNTPSYANLLQVASPTAWGSMYLFCAVLLFIVTFRRKVKVISIIAHGISLALMLWWLVAFIIRYATDDGTTIVNVISWSTYTYLLVRSALLIGDDVAFEEVTHG